MRLVEIINEFADRRRARTMDKSFMFIARDGSRVFVDGDKLAHARKSDVTERLFSRLAGQKMKALDIFLQPRIARFVEPDFHKIFIKSRARFKK
jgi:hypothetical protein